MKKLCTECKHGRFKAGIEPSLCRMLNITDNPGYATWTCEKYMRIWIKRTQYEPKKINSMQRRKWIRGKNTMLTQEQIKLFRNRAEVAMEIGSSIVIHLDSTKDVLIELLDMAETLLKVEKAINNDDNWMEERGIEVWQLFNPIEKNKERTK